MTKFILLATAVAAVIAAAGLLITKTNILMAGLQ